MTRKTGWRKVGSKGIVLLLSLLLLLSIGLAAHAQTEVPLKNYAASIQAELKANADGDALPPYVENGQKLFFGLQISNFNSQELVAYLKANPEADFTIPLDFSGHINGNYPTKINPDNPDDFDNVAYVNEEELFRWWIDEGNDVIRIRFDEEWINQASNNTVVENVKLGFAGTLNVADKGNDGKVVFNAAGSSFPLQMKTGYAITKTAGKPVYRDGQYVVDFTVKLTLDQKMNIVGTAGYDGYAALLTLEDTLNANSAMTGEIVAGPSITDANGLTVTAAKNGTANTFSFGGVTELNKGTYTIQFTMKLDGNAAAAKLEGYDKQNTVELKENNTSLTKPVKADVSIAWDNNVSNQFKVDKAILPQSSTTNVYIDGKDYYVDYIVVVYAKSPMHTFTVVDQIVSNAAHSEKAPTLLGVNTAENFWNSTAKNIPNNLTQMRTDVIDSISGSNRTITVTAPAGDMLPAGAYYLKVPVKVTDSVKTLAEAANKKISANQTQDVTVAYKNKAVLDAVDDDTAINEVSPEVTDTLRAPANFIKRGAIETDSSGNHTIYEKEGLRGKLIRWDVEFSWNIPDQYTVLTDTMKGGQVLLANGSTSFDIWDMSSGTPVSIDKLWNKNDRDYISFDIDANGNETFTFYPGRLSDDLSLSTRKFKLTYYTLVPEDTVDFTVMKNNWNISYPNPDTGVSIGPVPGEETPIMGDTVKLTMSKVAKDTSYDVHDMYLRWTVTINNSNKIPMSALGDLKLTEDVDLNKKEGVLKDVEFNVWFDPASRAPELVMYYGASSTITLERGVHYSVAVSDKDDSIMVIDFNEAAMAASLAEVDADRFNKIVMTVYTFNTDYNNVGGHNDSTYPRANIKNTAKLDYATSGMKQDTIESSATRRREFTTGMKRTAPLNGEWFTDYDNDGEKELRWLLEIGSGSFPKMNAIIKAVDTLPEGQKLKYEGSEWKKNFKVYLKSTNNSIMDVPLADDAFSINGDTFELTINKTQNVNNYYNIFIEYYTVFEDGVLQAALEKAGADANDITIPLNNQASLYLDGILLQETDITPDLTINNLGVDKTAKFLQSSGSKVNYTIEMNPYGLDMADGDVILLEDSMGDGKDVFSYIPSSFKLINQDTGAQMSPSSAASSTTYVLKMAEDGKSFTLDVPDNTHLKLTYQVKTTQPVGTQDVSLVNSASLAGRKPQAETITFDVSSAYQSGSFSVQPGEAGIRLVKISSEGADSDAPTFLSGAEFTVTRLDSSFQQVGTVQTMTTDAKGLIEIKEKLTDVVYVVVEETKAPEGYRLGSAPWKWCYALVPADKSLSDADVAKLKETVHCDVTVISAGNYVEDSIINEPVALTVRKVDEDGNLLEGAQFTLMMDDATVQADKTHAVAGELRFENLAQGSYILEETVAPEGYAVPEECPWSFSLDANGNLKLAEEYKNLSVSEDGLYLIVVNKPETVSVSARKEWKDNDNQHSMRPDAVEVQLYADEVPYGESVSLNEENQWSHEWTELPKYAEDKLIAYTVKEKEAVAGYVAAITGDQQTGFTITNTLMTVSVQFAGTKVIEGREMMADDVFSFEIVEYNAEGETGRTWTFDNEADGKINYPTLEYTLSDVDEYSYIVRETSVSGNGIIVDTVEYTVEVTVSDNGDGTLAAEVGGDFEELNFTNKAVGGFTFTKQDAQGNALPDAVFGVYTDKTCTNESKVGEDLTSDADGTVTMTDLDAGTTYYIQEITAPEGYLLNETVYDVTIQANQMAKVNNGAPIINEKKDVSVTAQLAAAKTVNGSSNVPDRNYSFELYELVDGRQNLLETVQNVAGAVTFSEITYNQAGTYTYLMKEIKGNDETVIYDETEFIATVTVTENDDGTLSAAVTYGDNGSAEVPTFANTKASVAVKVTKVWNHDGNGASNTWPASADVVLMIDGEWPSNSKYYATLKNNNDWTYIWNDLPKYRLENGQLVEIEYEVHESNVYKNYVVKLEKDETTQENYISYTLTNTYVKNDQKLELKVPVQKIVTGANTDEKFTFKMEARPSDPPAPMPKDADTDEYGDLYVTAETTGSASGTTVSFDTIEITAEKVMYDGQSAPFRITYGWTIREIIPDPQSAGVTYDEGWYEIMASFQIDEDGKLIFAQRDVWDDDWENIIGSEPDVTIYHYDADWNMEEIPYNDGNFVLPFTNAIETTSVSVNKKWEGSEPADVDLTDYLTVHRLVDGQLSDALTDENNHILRPAKGEDGKTYTFSGLAFGYAYAVKEEEIPGYETSYAPMNVGEDAGQDVDKDFALDGETITNTLVSGGFRFTKQDADGNALPGAVFGVYAEEGCTTKLHELTSAADGVVSLTGLDGGKTYYIKEITAPSGYVLNKTVYSVTIEAGVDDKLAGDNGVIVNERSEAEATFSFNKWISNYAVDGTDMPVLDFVFTVEPMGAYDDTMLAFGEGYPVDKAFTVTVKGDKAFEEIPTSFDLSILKAGTYEFKITEKTDDVPDGWVFSTDEVIVTIQAAQQADGSLTVEKILYCDQDLVLEFYNLYYGTDFFSATKQWTEYNDEEDIELKLYYREDYGEDGYGPWTEYTDDYTVTLDKLGNEPGSEVYWEITIDDLPICMNNKSIRYGVAEIGVDGAYIVTYKATNGDVITEDENGLRVVTHGGTIINERNTTEVSGTKVWVDNDNAAGLRPDSITINLLADGEVIETITVTEGDGWKWSFTDLPKYKDQGTEIVYTITEDAVDGYKSEVNGFDVTNTHEPETVEVTVTKIWNDRGNQGNSRPDHLTVVLLADGEETTMTATLNEANGWTETLGGLPKRMDGEEIAYSWDEVTVPDGYTISSRVTQNGVTTITNDYAANGSVQFGGTKTLTGTDLQADQFSFTLTDGNGVTETVKNDADGQFQFTEIKYDLDDVGEHTYIVTEVNDGKAGYTYSEAEYEIVVTVADKGDGILDVTYTVNGETDTEILFENEYAADATITISGEKTVGGEKPEADEIFSFQLKDADGKVLQEVENTGSSITFDEIPYTLEDAGKTYTYTIQESTESNEQYLTDDSVYTVQVTLTDKGDGTLSIDWTLEKVGEAAEKIAFDNTPLSHLDIEKTVIGRAGDQEKPFAFKVTLTDEDGKALKGTFPVEGANVTSIESGSYLHLKHGEKATVKCLPVGTKYLVEEDEYAAFETEARNAEGEITEEGSKAEFVNTLKTVSFSVTKEWQGGDNGLITLTLYENGKKMEPQPTYAEENNVYTYTNLPQYTEEGKAIVYAAKEKYMDGYMTIYRNIAPYAQETDMIYNGGTIVNKAVTSFHVQKVWEGLAEGEEVPAITLTLYCNGEKLDKKTPTPNEDGWYIWHNLPLTYKGEAAEYTVVEEPVDGFTVSYGEAAEGEEEPTCARDYGTIVNRKIPKTGDESRIGLWIALTALSGCLFILLMKKRKEA